MADLLGSTWRNAIAPCVALMARGRRLSGRQTKRHCLATTLKDAIRNLRRNIRKLEVTGAHPLLIAARNKALRKMQDELSELRQEGAAGKTGPGNHC